MDSTQFVHSMPDLNPILGHDEDLHQEVWVRIWCRRESIRDLPRYARRVATTVKTDKARRLARERPCPPEFGCFECHTDGQSSLLDEMLREEQRQLIRGAIEKLAPRQRQAIETVLAAEAGNAVLLRATSNSNMYKARRRLKELLRVAICD